MHGRSNRKLHYDIPSVFTLLPSTQASQVKGLKNDRKNVKEKNSKTSNFLLLTNIVMGMEGNETQFKS